MKEYRLNVSLCGGYAGGYLTVKAEDLDDACNKAYDIILKRLNKAFPELEIDVNIEPAELNRSDYEDIFGGLEGDEEIGKAVSLGFEDFAQAHNDAYLGLNDKVTNYIETHWAECDFGEKMSRRDAEVYLGYPVDNLSKQEINEAVSEIQMLYYTSGDEATGASTEEIYNTLEKLYKAVERKKRKAAKIA